MKQLTTLAMIGIAYFVIVIVTLHFLRPDLNPLSRPTSEYAVGPYGLLMTTAFLSMSLASLSLVIGLYKGIPQAARSRIGLILLGLWGVGVLVAMAFPIDHQGSSQTITGIIHRINGPLVFLSLTIGTILVSKGFRHVNSWQSMYRSAISLSLAMLATFIMTGVNMATDSGFGGLSQRVFLLTFTTWFILTTLHLRSTIPNQNNEGRFHN